MKIEIDEKDYNSLKEIKNNLLTQDNHITQYPIFCVYEKEEVRGDDNHYDKIVYLVDWDSIVADEGQEGFIFEFFEAFKDEIIEWFEGTGDEVNVNDKDDIESKVTEILDCTWSNAFIDHNEITATYIREMPKFVTACFTENAAKEYIEANKYNLNKPYVYVDTLHRNYEMILIRNILMNLE